MDLVTILSTDILPYRQIDFKFSYQNLVNSSDWLFFSEYCIINNTNNNQPEISLMIFDISFPAKIV